jgi:hypothetical protein
MVPSFHLQHPLTWAAVRLVFILFVTSSMMLRILDELLTAANALLVTINVLRKAEGSYE